MDDYVFAICTSGHLINSNEASLVGIGNLDMNEVPTEMEIVNPDYSVKQNYCPKCGSEVLTKCPECNNTIRAELPYNKSPDKSTIPDFCFTCGADFPWIETVEAEKQRDGDFIKIDDADIDGHFYPSLVYEINLCYKVQADQAVLVLNRKLIENLIVDILRAAFGMDELELFYNDEDGQIHSLNVLIENMKDRQTELQKYVPLEDSFFRTIEDMKYHGDASAHSIEENPAQDDISEKADKATNVTRTLFRLRNEAKTAHR